MYIGEGFRGGELGGEGVGVRTGSAYGAFKLLSGPEGGFPLEVPEYPHPLYVSRISECRSVPLVEARR